MALAYNDLSRPIVGSLETLPIYTTAGYCAALCFFPPAHIKSISLLIDTIQHDSK